MRHCLAKKGLSLDARTKKNINIIHYTHSYNYKLQICVNFLYLSIFILKSNRMSSSIYFIVMLVHLYSVRTDYQNINV